VATDKLSTAATLAGHVLEGGAGSVGTVGSPSAMSDNEMMGAADDLFCESFDAEAEATARLQVKGHSNNK